MTASENARREELLEHLLAFLAGSPTPFHATASIRSRLEDAGFERLIEGDEWSLEPGGRYVVTRNDASVVAFRTGRVAPQEAGWRMVGAHTDSPCLKLKPRPESGRHGYLQLGIEVYGGALLNPWFDRDLSLAGRVTFRTGDGGVESALVDFERPIAVIPSLAIHLDREANKSRSVNPQTDMAPMVLQFEGERPEVAEILLEELRRSHPRAGSVLDFELSLYDTQRPARVGLAGEFIASARLDNLLSCFLGTVALERAGNDLPCVLVCNDHEEVGSLSASGADGPFLRSMLERIVGDPRGYARAVQRSLLVSADNAHGVHPSFPGKHDDGHGPLLNRGPVIKVNASQRYATTSETAGLFRAVCERAGVPVQTFVSRADMACGTTIGPLTSGAIGVPTVDVGAPQLAMHSIRELAGTEDAWQLCRALEAFYRTPALGTLGA